MTKYAGKSGLIISMLDGLDTGYYAVQPNPERPHIDFMRVSRPTDKRSRFKDSIKVQTQHADMLLDKWAYWPGRDLLYTTPGIEDLILILLANKRKAGRLYAEQLGNCHRCNTHLTDERSRHYGFGPECEKYLEAEKDEIDDENNGSYEDLLMAGKLGV